MERMCLAYGLSKEVINGIKMLYKNMKATVNRQKPDETIIGANYAVIILLVLHQNVVLWVQYHLW